MQTGGIAVNLVFVHNVHTGGTGCLTAGALIKREVLILSKFLVVDGNFPVDTGQFQHLLDLFIVSAFPALIEDDAELKFPGLDDVEGIADQRCLDFLIVGLRLLGFLRQVMDIRDAFIGDEDMFHLQFLEITDTAPQGAMCQKRILRLSQGFRHIRCHYGLEFVDGEEERIVLFGLRNLFPAVPAHTAKWRLYNLIPDLQIVKEGNEHLHFLGNGVASATLCGNLQFL